MNNSTLYNATVFSLPKDTLRALTRLKPWRSTFDLFLVWVEIILLLTCARSLPSWAYPFLIFAIAGRQGALLQLVHEASHSLLHPSRRWNGILARLFCAYPLGVFFEGYAEGHLRHHQYTNTPNDPPADREKYQLTDFTNPRLYLLFLKDLVGITALSIFFSYRKGEADAPKKSWGTKLPGMVYLVGVQAVVISLLFRLNLIEYVLYWILPAMCAHMFLMRVRGIAEHGLALQLGVPVNSASEGAYYTRSFLTPQNSYPFAPLIWVEKLLIGSFSVHYHHEHHLFPGVPYYHLSELHQQIAPRVRELNPEVYAKGYFAATLRKTHALYQEAHA